ncbi:hypothetical protein OIO90_000918 [Microbotryomycetes sp. JL221]|nr:hypothetical protein OIO90_000918 [Microbotryomycetes sp. JL221]
MSDSDTLYDPPPRRTRSGSVNVGVPVPRSNSTSTSATTRIGSAAFDDSTLPAFRNGAEDKLGDTANLSDSDDDNSSPVRINSGVDVERIKRLAAAHRLPDSDMSQSDDGFDTADDVIVGSEPRPPVYSNDTGNARPVRDQSSLQDPFDEKTSVATERMGRRSKLQEMKEEPNYQPSMFLDQFHGELFELTHSIDELENDIDKIVKVRNKIATLSPKQDPEHKSLKAMLDGQAALVTDTGRRIVALEKWLSGLYEWMKDLRAARKRGTTSATSQDIAEVKFQLSSAKLDFANAMERIREGAWKEEERRERTRIWMAKHMRWRQPELEDDQVKSMLKAAELTAASGIGNQDVISYAGLFALRNPFTELAELTNGMDLMHDTLDREIVDEIVVKERSPSLSALHSDKPNVPYKFHVVDDKHLEALDFEYGFARGQRKQRELSRKRMVIALLFVMILFMSFIIWLASLKKGLGLHEPMDKEPAVDKPATDDFQMWPGVASAKGEGDPGWTFGATVAAPAHETAQV